MSSHLHRRLGEKSAVLEVGAQLTDTSRRRPGQFATWLMSTSLFTSGTIQATQAALVSPHVSSQARFVLIPTRPRVSRYQQHLRHTTHPLTLCSEFDFRVIGDGRSAAARYANNSNYRNDSLIRKESTVTIIPTSDYTLTSLQCASALS